MDNIEETQKLPKPLHERMFFADMYPDWLRFTVNSMLPSSWPVGEYQCIPSIKLEQEHESSFTLGVMVCEWRSEQEWWVARNSYGKVVWADCDPVIICHAMQIPGSRWQLDMVCFTQYAVDTFHELVRRLREAGGQLAGQSPSVGKKKRKQVDHHALPPEERKKLVNEYRRRTKAGKVSQAQFAETNGISVKTLGRWLKEFPPEADGHGQQV